MKGDALSQHCREATQQQREEPCRATTLLTAHADINLKVCIYNTLYFHIEKNTTNH